MKALARFTSLLLCLALVLGTLGMTAIAADESDADTVTQATVNGRNGGKGSQRQQENGTQDTQRGKGRFRGTSPSQPDTMAPDTDNSGTAPSDGQTVPGVPGQSPNWHRQDKKGLSGKNCQQTPSGQEGSQQSEPGKRGKHRNADTQPAPSVEQQDTLQRLVEKGIISAETRQKITDYLTENPQTGSAGLLQPDTLRSLLEANIITQADYDAILTALKPAVSSENGAA